MSTRTISKWPGMNLAESFGDFLEPWNEFFPNRWLSKTLTTPNVNVSENANSYNVSLAAPGLEKKDFKIETNGNVLTISAEKEQNTEEKDEKYSRQEYNYSSFSRSFTLPDEVEQSKIEASYANGVLQLTLPKNGTKKNRSEIEVK